MTVDETGVSNPAGIAFSELGNHFHVVRANVSGHTHSADMEIIQLNEFVDRFGSIQITASIAEPMNLAFDNRIGRLLSYHTQADKLIEVRQDPGGKLDLSTLVRHDTRHFEIKDPQGLSVDFDGENLFILDRMGPRIVQIEMEADGSFFNVPVNVLDLSSLAKSKFRGLAIDPSTGNFFVGSPDEQRLYELTNLGELIAVHDLSEYGLVNPQGMVFAPSGDQTDNPANMSLFVADSGNSVVKELIITSSSQVWQLEVLAKTGIPDIQTSGQIVELSLSRSVYPPQP